MLLQAAVAIPPTGSIDHLVGAVDRLSLQKTAAAEIAINAVQILFLEFPFSFKPLFQPSIGNNPNSAQRPSKPRNSIQKYSPIKFQQIIASIQILIIEKNFISSAKNFPDERNLTGQAIWIDK